jgi:hypothetical protein
LGSKVCGARGFFEWMSRLGVLAVVVGWVTYFHGFRANPAAHRVRRGMGLHVKTPQEKLSFDTQLLEVHLTGLQAEVEAKLRRVMKFREQMQKIDAAGGKTDRAARLRAARALVAQVDEMLETNALVRDTLDQLHETARAVLDDLNDA